MVDRSAMTAWIEAYERAWRTPGTDGLRALFTEDATYSMGPYDEPARGRSAIAELWERERTGPDESFTMTWDAIAVDGDTAVVRVEVRYHTTAEQFRDLWVLQFAPDGRCRAFEEWPFSPSQTAS
jgi:SnoaL-like domain